MRVSFSLLHIGAKKKRVFVFLQYIYGRGKSYFFTRISFIVKGLRAGKGASKNSHHRESYSQMAIQTLRLHLEFPEGIKGRPA